ncbi:MAG TPA: phenol hydroxylase subunit P4 [Ilumatobacteraceae bacterium]|nr:phenol hydroxylase subunit P4 [Ilumatobacteraceae bacterium]
MPVVALSPDYAGRVADARENFGPNQLVYFHWEKHLMFCAALAFPLPPEMPWAAVTGELLPQFYASHPDFASLDWSTVRWELDGAEFTPDPSMSLADNGVGHKSLIRLWTPGLDGLGDSGA